MAGAMKNVDKIRQIVRLKQILIRWKHMSLRRRSSEPKPCATTTRRPPSGFVFVYVGPERKRFSIPARFLNLPIFAGLLEETEEEFGLRGNCGLVLPCQVPFFTDIVKHLQKDEHKYGNFSLQEFVNMISDLGSDSCKENVIAFAPLLQKAKV
ncbi:auxin-induced protein X10A-like [Gastrolobium bilobum]|uniref:auxin-induced protein X10A-like n=1 Tax=Gastrolobium bilobum TaxID=150636 RepID=UPI002AB2B03B|nr:auxin-induced protein X10A-like [Gastrolobium bilobum]